MPQIAYTVLIALNNIEHEYKTAYIKAELIRTRHLDPDIAFVVFLCVICDFSGNEYKYNPAQSWLFHFVWEETIRRLQEFKVATWKKGCIVFDRSV